MRRSGAFFVGAMAAVSLSIMLDGGLVPVAAAELPGAPARVWWTQEASRTADGDIYLDWQAPASNGGSPITAYEIQQTKNGEWIDLYTFRSVSGRLALQINELPRGVTYRFRIAAVTAVGQGPWAESGDVRLRTVPSAPREVQWRVSPAGNLVVSWLKPADTGGPFPPRGADLLPELVSYRVWVTPDGQTWIPAATQRADLPLTLSSSAYQAGTRSAFAVSAVNEVGEGPRSLPTTWFEPTEARPEPVTNLRLRFRTLPSGKAAAAITWTPGNSGGSAQYYKITITVNGQTRVRSKAVQSPSFTLGNIPLKDYRGRPSRVFVSVESWNAKYFSPTSTTQQAYVP
jgi:hypothetical protein